ERHDEEARRLEEGRQLDEERFLQEVQLLRHVPREVRLRGPGPNGRPRPRTSAPGTSATALTLRTAATCEGCTCTGRHRVHRRVRAEEAPRRALDHPTVDDHDRHPR